MNAYDLPTSLTIGEVDFRIRYGWRSALDILAAFNDPDLDMEQKTEVMLRILYPDWILIPERHLPEAVAKACEFLDCGHKPNDQKRPRLMDWEQDASLIIPEINRVAGREIRFDPDIHWWTFIGWYMCINEGVFSSVLRIRGKRSRGKKLEKAEEEYYRDNKKLIDLRQVESAEVRQEKENILKWLNSQ
jgi:hypothetical protein